MIDADFLHGSSKSVEVVPNLPPGVSLSGTIVLSGGVNRNIHTSPFGLTCARTQVRHSLLSHQLKTFVAAYIGCHHVQLRSIQFANFHKLASPHWENFCCKGSS